MSIAETLTVRPLTVLSAEETLFRTTVRNFAEATVAPLVASMDETAQYDPALIPSLFDLGVMGIAIPEEYGGASSSFFMACLAIEELSRVDAAVGVLVDVHNTLVINAILRWATPAQQAHFLPRLAQHTVGAYSLSEAGAGSDAFALHTRANPRRALG
jgi:alkylation response protein AidB-like acyl-CoA dehydrogenase